MAACLDGPWYMLETNSMLGHQRIITEVGEAWGIIGNKSLSWMNTYHNHRFRAQDFKFEDIPISIPDGHIHNSPRGGLVWRQSRSERNRNLRMRQQRGPSKSAIWSGEVLQSPQHWQHLHLHDQNQSPFRISSHCNCLWKQSSNRSSLVFQSSKIFWK